MRVPLLLVLANSILLTPAVLAGDEPDRGMKGGMSSFHLFSSLARIAEHDPLGLGAEAELARSWASGRSSLSLSGLRSEEPVISDGEEERALSPELARALDRIARYVAVAQEARLKPVGSAELVEASMLPGGLEGVRSVFDEAVASAVVLEGELIVPELGGEAVLPTRPDLAPAPAEALPSSEWGLQLHRFRDPTRAALQAVARSRHHPQALARLFGSDDEDLLLLDENGQLRSELALYEQRGRQGVSLDRRRGSLDRAVDTILRNGADSFTLHPREQLETIIQQSGSWWPGRLVGLWHLHPPGWSDAGWVAAAPPSPDDHQVARATGRFLTLVFRPDGFDLHDLRSAPLGASSWDEDEPLLRYRSEEWRAHFAASWQRARGGFASETLTTSP